MVMGRPPIPESEYIKMAKGRGIEYLGGYTGSTKDKVRWRCDEGHEWEARYSSIKSGGHGCPKCFAESNSRPEADYHKLAKKRDFTYIGGYTGRVMDPVLWECAKGHRIRSRFNDVRRGAGCRKCYFESQRIKESEYHATAAANGLVFIGPYTGQTSDKVKWRCSKGHIFDAPFSNIQDGIGCARCYFDWRKSLTGSRNPNWNPEKTDTERKEDRTHEEYKSWRQAVYERDDYACQICGDNTSGNLVAHHLNSYAEYKDLRTDIDNGVTLCEPCHVEYHMTYGWEGACVADFIEFAENRGVHFSNPLINI